MKKIITLIIISLFLTSCNNESQVENDKLQIVTTYSILSDIVKNIVLDKADVYSMVPEGVDPHMYEPLPNDVSAMSNADIIFYNGLNLETGGKWFDNLLNVVDKVDNAYVVSENVVPMYLNSSELEKEVDPHAWLDVSNVIIYVENITKVLTDKDPDNAQYYLTNKDSYINELEQLHNYGKKKTSEIEEGNRILVSSEGAFKYFGKAYGIEAAYIWEINTDTQGSPEQMNHIINVIKENKVRALFNETSVNPKTMEIISEEVEVDIAATIFTDSLAKKGLIGDTYITMMKYNFDQINEGLK